MMFGCRGNKRREVFEKRVVCQRGKFVEFFTGKFREFRRKKMAETWAKLSGKISEKDMKILEDNIHINCHKKTSKELEEEISKMNEEIKRLKLRNDNIQHQIPLLKMDFDRSFQNIATANKVLRTSLQLLTDLQKQQLENSQQLNSKYSQHEQEFLEIKALYETQISEYKIYTETVSLLKQMQVRDKILSQELSDMQDIICRKKKIQREIFHKRIIRFVKAVKDYQENLKVLYLIERKTKEGNVLLKAYEEKCNRIEMEKRGVKSVMRFNNMQDVLPLVSGKLPSLSELPLPKPSPTMSVCSMKSSKKYSLGTAELNKMKEREFERMKLLQKLSSNESFFVNKDDVGLKKNKYPKLDISKTPRASKSQNLAKDNLNIAEVKKFGKDASCEKVDVTPAKKRSIEINYNLESVKKLSLNPPKKIEILDNITIIPKKQEDNESKKLSQEKKSFEEVKPQETFKQPLGVNSHFFGKKGKPETSETHFVQTKTTEKDDEIFKVPYDTSFEMKYSQDYSFIEDGACNFNMNKDFLSSDVPFDEASPFSPPHLITAETENDETNTGFADFPFGEKRNKKDKNSFFSFN